MPTLDSVQAEMIDAIIGRRSSGNKSTLLSAATGTGKTISAAKFIRRGREEWGGRFLFLANRINLVDQAEEKFKRWGLSVAVEMADRKANRATFFGRPDVVVGCIATMQGRRLEAWAPDSFTDLIADECFPAGTLVDGRPIETIRVDDRVRSFNPSTLEVEFRPVLRLFRNPCRRLVAIHLDSGKRIVCTPSHPIAVGSPSPDVCYRPAESICPGDLLYSLDDEVTHAEGQPETPDPSMLRLQGHGGMSGPETPPASPQGPSVLLGRLPGQVPSREQEEGRHPPSRPGDAFGEDEGPQPDVHPRGQGEDGGIAFQGGMEAEGPGRQRSDHGAATEARRCPGLADRGGHTDQGSQGERLPVLLQGGSRQSRPDGGDRGGRRDSQESGRPREGREEGGIASFPRVVRVEVHEPGGDGEFERLCPDGHVYNFEVGRNHNYFVEGVLVHNCHGSKSKTTENILRHFSGRKFLLGLTATPYRTDGRPLTPDPFEDVAFDYPLLDYPDGRPGAITNGHLAPVRLVECGAGVSLKGLRIVKGKNGSDYTQGELEDRVGKKVETLANAARRKIQEFGLRCVLGFAPGVQSAMAFADAFNAIGIPSRAIHGDHPDRDAIDRQFRDGDFTLLMNSDLYTTGYDHPPIEGIVMARPTQSRGLAWQMLGRGTRTFPGKECCRTIGFSWESDGKGPVSTLDLFLNPEADDRTKQIARRLAAIAGDADAMAVVKQATEIRREEVQAEAKEKERKDRARLRISAQKKDVACRYRTFDLTRSRSAPQQYHGLDVPPSAPTTHDQRAILRELKIPSAGISSAGEADAAIRSWQERASAGFATARQCDYLARLGLGWQDAMALTGKEASQMIDQLRGRQGVA